jgi:ribose transport system permease protein
MQDHKIILPENKFTRTVRSHKKTIAVLLLILALSIVGEIIVGNFISLNQALMTVKFASFTALFALCQMIVVSGGGNALDLSIGYIATLSAILGVAVMDGSNEGLFLAVLVAVGVGLFFGLMNGLLISFFKLSPLVVTMSMSSVLQGIINVYGSGMSIGGKPSPVLQTVAAHSTGSFPNIIFLLIAVIVVVYILLHKTNLGPVLFGVGENPNTALLSGANVRKIRCLVFVISGIIAGLIGLILAGNMNMAYKDMASAYICPLRGGGRGRCIACRGRATTCGGAGAVFSGAYQTCSVVWRRRRGTMRVTSCVYIVLLDYAATEEKINTSL